MINCRVIFQTWIWVIVHCWILTQQTCSTVLNCYSWHRLVSQFSLACFLRFVWTSLLNPDSSGSPETSVQFSPEGKQFLINWRDKAVCFDFCYKAILYWIASRVADSTCSVVCIATWWKWKIEAGRREASNVMNFSLHCRSFNIQPLVAHVYNIQYSYTVYQVSERFHDWKDVFQRQTMSFPSSIWARLQTKHFYKEVLRHLLCWVPERRSELWQDNLWLLHLDCTPTQNVLSS